MASFASTFINKIDSKGRLSVPAGFRAALGDQGFHGIIAYPSFDLPALEAGGMERVTELMAQADALEEYSPDYRALTSLLSDIVQLPFDSEGRIILPPPLLEHAGITEHAAFAGRGHTFEIWDPAQLQRHQEEMRRYARENHLRLPPRRVTK
ncbi:MAG TPA: division/cell wall cluster transcriptional repressor MraZ [Stellaceae bacterium]|nr:division/cell wall cluster transcriptional repressor MraZ [Stellaceae bacterium]